MAAPCTAQDMAERVGFEPTAEFPLHSLSRRAVSTAQTPLRANSGASSLTNAPNGHNSALWPCAMIRHSERARWSCYSFTFFAGEIVPRKIVMDALGSSNRVSAATVIFERA